jgi:hypothetical protein
LGRAAQHKAILPNRGGPKSLRAPWHGQRQASEDKVPKDRRRPSFAPQDEDRLAMDVRTLILLAPAAIFIVSGIIWYWTNEL